MAAAATERYTRLGETTFFINKNDRIMFLRAKTFPDWLPYCYYCRRVLILANFSDFVIIAKFCPR